MSLATGDAHGALELAVAAAQHVDTPRAARTVGVTIALARLALGDSEAAAAVLSELERDDPHSAWTRHLGRLLAVGVAPPDRTDGATVR